MDSSIEKSSLTNISKKPYLKLVDINTSSYFNQCWMKIDPAATSPIMQSNDPSYAYSDNDSLLRVILFAPLSLIGVALNVLVIWAVLRNAELRKECLSFTILSLSLTDLLWSLGVTPEIALLGLLKDFPIPHGCVFQGFFGYVLWEISVLTLLLLATLRVLGVWFPMNSQNPIFHHVCKLLPVICWIFASLSLAPIITQHYGRFGVECKKFMCVIVDVDQDQNQLSLHPIKIFMSVIIFAGVLSTFLNILTFIKVSRSTRAIFSQMKDSNKEVALRFLQREKKLQIMVFGLTASFIIVYCPIIVLLIIDPNAAITKPTVYIMATFFASSLVVVDPIICSISQEKYRKEIKSILSCIYSNVSSMRKKCN